MNRSIIALVLLGASSLIACQDARVIEPSAAAVAPRVAAAAADLVAADIEREQPAAIGAPALRVTPRQLATTRGLDVSARPQTLRLQLSRYHRVHLQQFSPRLIREVRAHSLRGDWLRSATKHREAPPERCGAHEAREER